MAEAGVQSGRLKDEDKSRLRHPQIKYSDTLMEAGRQAGKHPLKEEPICITTTSSLKPKIKYLKIKSQSREQIV
jgi:hypothetical protein